MLPANRAITSASAQQVAQRPVEPCPVLLVRPPRLPDHNQVVRRPEREQQLVGDLVDGPPGTQPPRAAIIATPVPLSVRARTPSAVRAFAMRGSDSAAASNAAASVLPLLKEKEGPRPPVMICGVVPLVVSSKDTAPFGLGLQPPRTAVGRLRNRALNLLVSKVIFRRAQRLGQELLADLVSGDFPASCRTAHRSPTASCS